MLSQFIWVQSSFKRTAAVIGEKFEKILKDSGTPKILFCDQDAAFIADSFQKLLKKYKIECHFAVGDHKAFLSELSGKLLQRKIAAYCTENNTKRWIDKLQAFVRSLNKRKLHSLGGKSPDEINFSNSAKIFRIRYGELHKKFIDHHKKVTPLKVGQFVRVKLKRKSGLSKGYMPLFSTEIYQIYSFSNTANGVFLYKLKDQFNHPVKGRFPIQQLSPVYL